MGRRKMPLQVVPVGRLKDEGKEDYWTEAQERILLLPGCYLLAPGEGTALSVKLIPRGGIKKHCREALVPISEWNSIHPWLGLWVW